MKKKKEIKDAKKRQGFICEKCGSHFKKACACPSCYKWTMSLEEYNKMREEEKQIDEIEKEERQIKILDVLPKNKGSIGAMKKISKKK